AGLSLSRMWMSRSARPPPKHSSALAGRRCQMRRSLVTIHAMTTIRVGLGHDTHRFAEGRPLLLGGVRIAHPRGLVGHSDADVVLHALTDALLGAAGLGDIGDAYPDAEPAWKDADSRVF